MYALATGGGGGGGQRSYWVDKTWINKSIDQGEDLNGCPFIFPSLLFSSPFPSPLSFSLYFSLSLSLSLSFFFFLSVSPSLSLSFFIPLFLTLSLSLFIAFPAIQSPSPRGATPLVAMVAYFHEIPPPPFLHHFVSFSLNFFLQDFDNEIPVCTSMKQDAK